MVAFSGVQIDFIYRNTTKDDSMYQKLVKQVQKGMIHQHWLNNRLHAKGNTLFVPKVGGL